MGGVAAGVMPTAGAEDARRYDDPAENVLNVENVFFGTENHRRETDGAEKQILGAENHPGESPAAGESP